MYKNLLKFKNNNLGVLISKEIRLSRNFERAFTLKTFNQSSNLNNENTIGYRENFASRHIGINDQNEKAMLQTLKLSVNTCCFFKPELRRYLIKFIFMLN